MISSSTIYLSTAITIAVALPNILNKIDGRDYFIKVGEFIQPVDSAMNVSKNEYSFNVDKFIISK